MADPDLFLFVSHVSEDRPAALEIVDELERRGVPCWIAPRDVRPGRPFDDEIAEAIEASRALLLIFSNHCNEHEYIRREVTFAGESHKVVIPFRIEDAQPKRGLRVRLSDLHWIDGFVSRERAIDQVVRTIDPDRVRRRQEERRAQEEERRRAEEREQQRAEEQHRQGEEKEYHRQQREAEEEQHRLRAEDQRREQEDALRWQEKELRRRQVEEECRQREEEYRRHQQEAEEQRFQQAEGVQRGAETERKAGQEKQRDEAVWHASELPKLLSWLLTRRAQIALSVIGIALALLALPLVPGQREWDQLPSVICTLVVVSLALVTFLLIRSEWKNMGVLYTFIGLNTLIMLFFSWVFLPLSGTEKVSPSLQ